MIASNGEREREGERGIVFNCDVGNITFDVG